MPRKIRVRDLPVSPAPGVKLFCLECRGEYSAARGDYPMSEPDSVISCCGDSLRLSEPTALRLVRAS
jgi:hypothetical protein